MKTTQKLEEYHVDCSKAAETIRINKEAEKKRIFELCLSTRSYNIIMTSGFEYVDDIERLIRDNPEGLLQIKGLGEKSREELLSKLEAEGIDVSAVRKLMKRNIDD